MSALAGEALRLQADIHAALNADPDMVTLLGQAGIAGSVRAYDDVPPDPVFPYLSYGNIRSEDSSGDAAGQSTHQITLHVWSRQSSRAETLMLLDRIEIAIRAQLPHRAIPIYTDIFRAPDGRTRHGLLRLSIIMETEL